MGVGFNAYSHIQHTPNVYTMIDSATDDTIDGLMDWLDSEGFSELFAYRGFHRSTRGLVNHKGENGSKYLVEEWYRVGESKYTWDTSYGWYSYWRKMLSKAVLEVSPKKVWNNPKKYKNLPFFELINFADNEGTIGPTACRDLLVDFEKHRDIFVNYVKKKTTYEHEQNSCIQFYDNFREGLRVASHHGCITLF